MLEAERSTYFGPQHICNGTAVTNGVWAPLCLQLGSELLSLARCEHDHTHQKSVPRCCPPLSVHPLPRLLSLKLLSGRWNFGRNYLYCKEKFSIYIRNVSCISICPSPSLNILFQKTKTLLFCFVFEFLGILPDYTSNTRSEFTFTKEASL